MFVIQQARKNLIDFEIATDKDYDPNWHHELIAEQLEHIEKFGDRDYKILVISVPPRHGKSQQCSIDFPAWYLGRNPDKEIITTSYSADLAQDFGGRTRTKVNSPEFKLIFGDVKLKEDEKAKGHWRTGQEGGYVSAGVGGPITGKGANILLIDDPIKNREEAESEVIREKIWNWFTSTAYTRLEPKGVIVIIMTRWHEDDLVGRITKNKELSRRTKIIRLPAIAEIDDSYRKQGEALWNNRYSLKDLEDTRNTVGPYDFNALYQGSPVRSEDQEFQQEWIRRIDESSVEMMNCRRFLSIDTAMSKKNKADFTGFCDNSVNQENFWHLKAWRMKIGPEELVNAIFSLHTRNNYQAIGIEKTAYLEGLKPYLDEEQRKRDMFLPIVELSHNQINKEIRIRGLIPRYATGSVFHINNQCSNLEEEMISFPSGIHDDVLDSLAYQLQLTNTPRDSYLKTFIPKGF